MGFEYLFNVALAQAKHIADRTDPKGAIANQLRARNLLPPGRGNLGDALLAGLSQARNDTNLGQFILDQLGIIKLVPRNHPDRSMSAKNLANALLTRLKEVGDHAEVDHYVLKELTSLGLIAAGPPNRSMNFNNLANAILARLKQLGDRNMLLSPVLDPEEPFDTSGHSCDLYRAWDDDYGWIAIKRPRGTATQSEASLRRFEREVEIWRKIQHPSVLTFLGTYPMGGSVCLISPFISNGNLSAYVSRKPDVDRVRLLRETSEALEYLHSLNIVHGDLKGSNILVSDEEHTLLTDFGLSKLTSTESLTTAKGFGTLRWQSPELLDGGSKSFQSDVWAFGMTIVEILKGELPFATYESETAFVIAVMKEERPEKSPLVSPTGVSWTGIWNVAEVCWPTNPADRPSMTIIARQMQDLS